MHFGESKTCSMSCGSLTKTKSAGPSQNLVKLFCWYLSSIPRTIAKRSVNKKLVFIGNRRKVITYLTVFIFPNKLMRAPNDRVSLWTRNLISEIVQQFVTENPFDRADYQNYCANYEKHCHDSHDGNFKTYWFAFSIFVISSCVAQEKRIINFFSSHRFVLCHS